MLCCVTQGPGVVGLASPSLRDLAGTHHTISQAHTSQTMSTSILRPLEKEGFRWMLPFWSASGNWHT